MCFASEISKAYAANGLFKQYVEDEKNRAARNALDAMKEPQPPLTPKQAAYLRAEKARQAKEKRRAAT